MVIGTPNHSVSRAVKLVLKAQATQDGAGVSLYRAIGNPALQEIDPFLLLDEIHSGRPADYAAGFPLHPHRGFETLSYIVHGRMRHRDSRGNEGIIESGGIQWMSAARGILHSEIPDQDGGLFWGYQLWINLPAAKKMDEPKYSGIPAERIPTLALKDNGFIKVIAGEDITDQPGPVVRGDIDLVFLDVYLPPHARLFQPLPKEHTVFAYLADGEVEFGCGSCNSPALIRDRTVVVFDAGDHVSAITEDSDARFLLIAGQPLDEPIARQGPFVMNTKDEIDQANLDYKNGSMYKPEL